MILNCKGFSHACRQPEDKYPVALTGSVMITSSIEVCTDCSYGLPDGCLFPHQDTSPIVALIHYPHRINIPSIFYFSIVYILKSTDSNELFINKEYL